jgi:hypothetical protein
MPKTSKKPYPSSNFNKTMAEIINIPQLPTPALKITTTK